MKITCDVIKDILPLYAEGLASADTAALAEEHLAACPTCRKALEELRAPVKYSADTNAAPLKRIRLKLRTQRAWTVLLSALLALVVAVAAFGFLTSPEYLPYSIKTIALTVHQDGLLSVRFGTKVSGYSVFSEPSETGGGEVIRITAWTSVLSKLTGGGETREIILNPNGETVAAAYYFRAYDAEHHWLFGEGDENVVTLPRLFLAYYIVAALALAVLLLLAALILRAHKKARTALWRAALVPISYLIAHVCIKGGLTTTYAPLRDLSLILLAMVPIYGVLLAISARHAKRRSAKGRAEP